MKISLIFALVMLANGARLSLVDAVATPTATAATTPAKITPFPPPSKKGNDSLPVSTIIITQPTQPSLVLFRLGDFPVDIYTIKGAAVFASLILGVILFLIILVVLIRRLRRDSSGLSAKPLKEPKMRAKLTRKYEGGSKQQLVSRRFDENTGPVEIKADKVRPSFEELGQRAKLQRKNQSGDAPSNNGSAASVKPTAPGNRSPSASKENEMNSPRLSEKKKKDIASIDSLIAMQKAGRLDKPPKPKSPSPLGSAELILPKSSSAAIKKSSPLADPSIPPKSPSGAKSPKGSFEALQDRTPKSPSSPHGSAQFPVVSAISAAQNKNAYSRSNPNLPGPIITGIQNVPGLMMMGNANVPGPIMMGNQNGPGPISPIMTGSQNFSMMGNQGAIGMPGNPNVPMMAGNPNVPGSMMMGVSGPIMPGAFHASSNSYGNLPPPSYNNVYAVDVPMGPAAPGTRVAANAWSAHTGNPYVQHHPLSGTMQKAMIDRAGFAPIYQMGSSNRQDRSSADVLMSQREAYIKQHWNPNALLISNESPVPSPTVGSPREAVAPQTPNLIFETRPMPAGGYSQTPIAPMSPILGEKIVDPSGNYRFPSESARAAPQISQQHYVPFPIVQNATEDNINQKRQAADSNSVINQAVQSAGASSGEQNIARNIQSDPIFSGKPQPATLEWHPDHAPKSPQSRHIFEIQAPVKQIVPDAPMKQTTHEAVKQNVQAQSNPVIETAADLLDPSVLQVQTNRIIEIPSSQATETHEADSESTLSEDASASETDDSIESRVEPDPDLQTRPMEYSRKDSIFNTQFVIEMNKTLSAAEKTLTEQKRSLESSGLIMNSSRSSTANMRNETQSVYSAFITVDPNALNNSYNSRKIVNSSEPTLRAQSAVFEKKTLGNQSRKPTEESPASQFVSSAEKAERELQRLADKKTLSTQSRKPTEESPASQFVSSAEKAERELQRLAEKKALSSQNRHIMAKSSSSQLAPSVEKSLHSSASQLATRAEKPLEKILKTSASQLAARIENAERESPRLARPAQEEIVKLQDSHLVKGKIDVFDKKPEGNSPKESRAASSDKPTSVAVVKQRVIVKQSSGAGSSPKLDRQDSSNGC